MGNYNIDCWNHNTNTYSECIAVWSTEGPGFYTEWCRELVAHGGEWDAPDGCTYYIHEDEEDE